MTKHQTATRETWLKARVKLLAAEKALTRQGDALAVQRQALPWVRLDKDYRFATTRGERTLKELFGGRSQLLVYHFMYGPDYKAGCPSCSAIADGFDGIVSHLQNHDVAFWAVSRARLPALQAYRQRLGWRFNWASALDGDFNFDFEVSVTPEQQRAGSAGYNYRRGTHALDQAEPPPPVVEIAQGCGTDAATFMRERPGLSAFAIQDGAVHHTYSAYARGLDAVWGMYQWLDRAPLGRNEQGIWWRRHDEYAA